MCPGHELRLECTVVGGILTVWTGSAFDCLNLPNEIILHHSRFEGEKFKVCNNRTIGHSINTTSDSDGIKYISQLIIQLDESGTLDLEGRTVECVHDNGTDDIVIGTYVISYTRSRGKSKILK